MKVLSDKMREWRHHLHRNPELSSNEFETAAFIAKELRAMGVEVAEGIGGTGVVGTLKCGDSPRIIGLRAEMDAIPVTEQTDCEFRSLMTAQCMHAVTTGIWRLSWELQPCCLRTAISTEPSGSYSSRTKRPATAP